MDWLGAFEPVKYVEIEPVTGAATGAVAIARLAWLGFAVLLMMAFLAWSRQRIVRRSFRCADAGREVEVCFRGASVLSCSAFEDPTAVACGRRCRSAAFRSQWPPALPVLGPYGRSRAA